MGVMVNKLDCNIVSNEFKLFNSNTHLYFTRVVKWLLLNIKDGEIISLNLFTVSYTEGGVLNIVAYNLHEICLITAYE